MPQNEWTLGELLRHFAQSDKVKPRLYQKKIETAWQGMMGVATNRHTRSIRLKHTILEIWIDAPSLRQELHFEKEKIKERLNAFLGEDYITEVRLR